MHNEIFIKAKDDSVSYEDIQELLNFAHKQNAQHGLVYATFNQPIEKLVAKIGNGICFVALTEIASRNGLQLVGTCTLEERVLKYWYVAGGGILLLKLVGVHPEYNKMGIGGKLVQNCLDYASKNNYKMIVTDSAEDNMSFRKLMNKTGFKIVDCVKYEANNFISTVYARWIDCECPWSDDIRIEKYMLRRKEILETNENRK